MTTTSTNILTATRNEKSGFVAYVSNFIGAFRDAYTCRNLIETLQRKPDSELAAIGLKRGEITAYAFKKTYHA